MGQRRERRDERPFRKESAEHLHTLSLMGIRLLNPLEIYRMSESFTKEIKIGIESKSQSKDGIKMYRSHLAPRPRETVLPEGNYSLVVEVGGTNAYAAIVEPDEAGSARIARDGEGNLLFVKAPLRPKNKQGKREYANPEDFFGELVDKMSPLMDKAPLISSLGVVYSFPGEAKAFGAKRIDVQSDAELPKDFIIPGIHGREVEGEIVREIVPTYIGESLLSAIRARNPSLFVEGEIPIVVGNDTVAVGLSVAGSKVGGIVGTGFNFTVAANVDGEFQYLNTEAGGSASVPETEIFRRLGWSNSKRSIHPAERQISGAGIGDILDYAANYLINENQLPQLKENPDKSLIRKLTPETLTSILNNDLQSVSDEFSRPLTEEEFDMLFFIANTLVRRSAQITGTMMGTFTKVFPDAFTETDVFVPIEGSVFWKVPGYKDDVAQFAHEIAKDKTFSFGNQEPEQAGIKGIGAYALSLTAS